MCKLFGWIGFYLGKKGILWVIRCVFDEVYFGKMEDDFFDGLGIN